MRKDGFDFFSFAPQSLEKHEARVHTSNYTKLNMINFMRVAVIIVLIAVVLTQASKKEGTVKIEYHTEEYLKDTTVDFKFPLHNFMVMNDPNLRENIGETMWNDKVGARRLRRLETD